jgi:hypothetical protein
LQRVIPAGANSMPLLSGAYLVVLAAALALATWAVGIESYPYISQPIRYRFSLATLDRVYLAALLIFALHYAAFVVHFLTVGSRASRGTAPELTFRAARFVISWLLLVGLIGTYGLGASIATPKLFDQAFGPARETGFLRVWSHTYFGFILLASLAAAFCYLTFVGLRERGSALGWLSELVNLRAGHRFEGALNAILLLALGSNIVTGLFILGNTPLVGVLRLPLHSYGMENVLRLVHDTGTAFVVASFSGQIYFRLIPANRWMLKTMFGGYEARI